MSKLYYTFFVLGILIISCQSEERNEFYCATETTPGKGVYVNKRGKELFYSNCARCHHQVKDATGPALKGSLTRTPGKEWVYKFVHNPSKLIADGDKYANEIYEKWNKTTMTAFPSLRTEDIDSIMDYCDNYH